MISLPHGGASFKKRSLESDILGLRNWLSLSGFKDAMVEEIITLFKLKNVWDLMNLSDEKILNSNLTPWHQEELVEARMGDVKTIMEEKNQQIKKLQQELKRMMDDEKRMVDEKERVSELYRQELKRLRVQLYSCQDENKNFKDEIRVLRNKQDMLRKSLPNARKRVEQEEDIPSQVIMTKQIFNPYLLTSRMNENLFH